MKRFELALTPDQLKAFREALPAWFMKNRRAFPWRNNRTAYRVWVSELMLQQTRADQVVAYYRRFLKAFPSLRALAEAPRSRVLKLWEGLGYYARARNLHDAAQYLVRECGGQLPRSYDGLKALPGIGPYTAAAVGSLAFNLDVAVVDGNVIRVLTRAFGYYGDVTLSAGKKQIQSWADALLPLGAAAVFNEAMMELGAVICTPRNPGCGICPLASICVARAEQAPDRYPVKKKKKPVPHKVVGAAIVLRRDGKMLIARRPEDKMLGGLWEFPGGKQHANETMNACIARELKEELGIAIEVGDPFLTIRHAYSHFTIELHVHWARICQGRPRAIECAEFAWVAIDELRSYAFSRADLYVVDGLESSPQEVRRQQLK